MTRDMYALGAMVALLIARADDEDPPDREWYVLNAWTIADLMMTEQGRNE